MDPIFWTWIGTTVAVLTSFGFVLQIMKMWRNRLAVGISLAIFLQYAAGVSLWTLYGMFRGIPVLIGSSLITLVTLSIGLALFYRFRRESFYSHLYLPDMLHLLSGFFSRLHMPAASASGNLTYLVTAPIRKTCRRRVLELNSFLARSTSSLPNDYLYLEAINTGNE